MSNRKVHLKLFMRQITVPHKKPSHNLSISFTQQSSLGRIGDNLAYKCGRVSFHRHTVYSLTWCVNFMKSFQFQWNHKYKTVSRTFFELNLLLKLIYKTAITLFSVLQINICNPDNNILRKKLFDED